MRVEFALVATLLTSSILAYGEEDWGRTGSKAKTVTKYITKQHWNTKTVYKTKCITKTKVKTEVKTVTVTAIPSKGGEAGDAVDPELEPDIDGDQLPPPKNKEEEPKPQVNPAKPVETDDEEDPKEKPEPGVESEEQEPPEPKKYAILATTIDGKPVFKPSSLKAAIGDTIDFLFRPMNHSVVRGSFDKPCVPVEDTDSGTKPFFSGFFPVKSLNDEHPIFRIKVEDSEPIWFYCSAGRHCQDGMVGVINPSSDKNVEDYAAAAAKAPVNISPKKVNGGMRKRSLYFY
ncbi:hypothetical protein TWF281_007871 [Arthrobotrys megalospora]